MRAKSFRLLCAVTAGGLAVAGVITVTTIDKGHVAARAALAVNTSSRVIDLDSCPVLAEGYRGGCAAQLEAELNDYAGADLTVDSVFGAATKKAVIAFQQSHGIPADGIVGLQTKAALDVASGNAVPTPTLKGSAPSSARPATTASTDVKIVRYIHSFSIPGCVTSFVARGILGGVKTCSIIDATSNPTPSAGIAATDASWTAFQDSQEYRSIVHLPPYQMTCNAAGDLVSPPQPLSAPGISAGFTPVRLLVHTFHVAGEKYQGQGGIWYNVNPEVDIVTPSTARITYRVAARAGTAENIGNPTVSGYSLPFIWTLIQEQLSCGRAPATLVTYSQMPSIMVFKDGTRVLADIQTSDLGGFVKSGGIGNPVPGRGSLYVPCRAFGMDQLAGASITPDCTAAASPDPSWAVFPAP